MLSCLPLHFLLYTAWNADMMAGALVATLHQVVILKVNVIWRNVEENDRSLDA